MKNETMSSNWKFTKNANENWSKVGFDDSNWRVVEVPHDYAIEGPFSSENDKQVKEVIADGIVKPVVHIGRTGGLPINDHGFYRKTFNVSQNASRVYIEFDGVMNNGTIYINGTQVYKRHYGYISYSVDITDFVKKGEQNLLAVSTQPKESSTRWYPGAGIYRDVRLIEKNSLHIKYNGTYITTTVKGENASVCVETSIENFATNIKNVEVETKIVSPKGEVVATNSIISSNNIVNQTLNVTNAELWSIEQPSLYKAITVLKVDGKQYDKKETTFGIRTIEFKADSGFFLNGKYTKLKGVCLHHDHGPLGGAFNYSAMKRQLEIMQDMGCNAIRTSHNPPATQLLDLCDSLGFVVLDEAFDEWKVPKVTNGYFKYFDQWAKIDLSDQIIRDRNHPCVIMWSVGNEILDQEIPQGKETIKMLCDVCKQYDPTRPTTAGFNNPDKAIENGLADVVDIVGLNYKPHRYIEFKKAHPNWIIYGSETESCVSSRGFYKLTNCDKLKTDDIKTKELHVNSFDISAPPWGYYPEREFAMQDDIPWVLGEFVWTGFDYLGEPTPYREEWPSRSSYFGIVDLVGMKKDRFYSYQAKWSNKDVLHLFPHWNWEKGESIPVQCYSNYNKVELFLNGKSLGIATKNSSDEMKRYRLVWNNVQFEEGELKAVAVENQNVFNIVKTAKEPSKLVLTPERNTIKANGKDLCYIKIDVVDEFGTICPLANNKIDFKVTGEGEYVASDNGDQTSLRVFSEKYCNAFSGSLMVIVKAKNKGDVTLIASSKELGEYRVTIKAN